MSAVAAIVLQPGEILAGRYSLVRPLGEGGVGVVWEGKQLTTDKSVAIKVLKDRGDSSDGAVAARFLREAKVAAGLSHRNIVQVFDYWEVEGGPAFLVMELLVGEPLSALLARRCPLPHTEALALLVPVANALRAAHASGVVHRDLKPENIFLSRTDEGAPEIKVVDFGLAKPMMSDAQATSVTQTGSVMGTPFYMSPEQVYGEKDVDTRSDVWSLGVVLYQCIVGRKPFDGENFGQVFRAITQAPAPPIREVAPHVPVALEQLVMRMLSHAREHRPPMAEVVQQLALIQATNPWTPFAPASAETTYPLSYRGQPPSYPSNLPPTPPARSSSAPAPVATIIASSASVRTAAASRPSSLSPALVLGMGALVVTVVGGVYWLQAEEKSGARSSPTTIVLPEAPAAPSAEPPIQVPQTTPAAPAAASQAPDAGTLEPASKSPVAKSPAPKRTPQPGSVASAPPLAAPPPQTPPSRSPGDPLSRGRF